MSFRINGLSPTDLGFTVARLNGWADGPTVSRGYAQRPGPYGGFVSDLESVAPRIIRFEGLITGQTIATRDAALDTVTASLEGLLEVEFDDSENKVVLARLHKMTVVGVPDQHNFVIPDLRVIVELIAHQAVKFDKYGSIVRLGDAWTNDGILVGTAPTLGRIWIHEATDPVIKLYDFRNIEVESITLTVTLSASESLIIDLYAQAIYEVDSETSFTRNDSLLTAGQFFDVKPEYADRANEIWPKLDISDGFGWFEFRRCWRT